MFKKFISILGAAVLLPTMAYAVDAAAVLQKADAGRSPYINSKLTITMESFEDDALDDSTDFLVHTNNADSLVDVMSGRSQGQKVLLIEKGMYVATKRASRPVRITPLQRLMGQASYGDLASLRLSADYTPTFISENDTEYLFELNAKTKKATYRKLNLWIEKGTNRLLRSEAFLASGKLTKRITYVYDDNNLVSQIIYTDPKFDNKKTVMNITSLEDKALPSRYFRPDGMRDKIR